MSDKLAIVGSSNMMPAMTIEEAVSRYNSVVEFTKKVMKRDKDYGVIPGTGTKPTLLKPGAEKLCSLFGLAPKFVIVDKIVDFDGGLFYFHYSCALYRNEQHVATGEGSANSKEKKYRYRNVAEKKATEAEKAAALRVETKSGKYGPYKVYVIENAEPFDLINTLQKMAQKRALVAATLIAANASEFFTQDVEDMDFIEGEYVDVVEDEKPAPKKATKKTQQPKEPKVDMASPDDIYQAVVDAKLSENTHSARAALGKCRTGYETSEKAIAWMRTYRAKRDEGLDSTEAATFANA